MRTTKEPRPRAFLRIAMAFALTLGGVMTLGSQAQADPAVDNLAAYEEALPQTAPPPPNLPNYGTTIRNGVPVGVMVAGGIGGVVNIVDLQTKQKIKSFELDASNEDVQPWGFATLSDGTVMIGSNSNLYQYNPKDDSVTKLSADGVKGYDAVKGRMTFVWDMAVGDGDTVYVAGQNKDGLGGHVLAYHPANGWSLLKGADPVEAGQNDARSISYENGKLYVSTGTTKPQVYQIDTKTGEKAVVPLPANMFANGLMPYLTVKGGILYAKRMQGGKGTVAYNLTSGETWEVPEASGAVITRPGEASKVYYTFQATEGGPVQLKEYDPATKTGTPLFETTNLLPRLSPNSWVNHDWFLSSEMNGGRMSIYSAGSEGPELVSGLVEPARRTIQSLTAADNGKLYGSWYMSTPALLEVSPAAKAAETTSRTIPAATGQGEAIVAHGDHLVTGFYPDARVSVHSLSNLEEPKNTTEQMLPGQDRPFAIAPISEHQFAIGTVPVSGMLGGALAFFDASTGDFIKDAQGKTVAYDFKNLPHADGVPVDQLKDQSPVSMAHKDGKLYIGTTIRGGHGLRAKGQEARLVEFDVNARKVTRILNPFPGEGQAAVTALTFGDDGTLYASTGQYVFKVDTANLKVVGTPANVSKGGAVAENRSWMVYHQGQVLTYIGGALYAFQAGNLSGATPIAKGVSGLTLGKDGYLYYARGADLYRNSYLKK